MDQQTALQLAADELEERALGYRQIEILDYVPTQPERTVLCPIGSVTVFVAAQGDPILQRVRDAVTDGDGGDVELVENYIRPSLGDRERVTYYQAWRQLKRSPVFCSIRYGGRTLATNIFLPTGLDFVMLENPHNGGSLDPPNLTLVEHRLDDTDFALDAVAIRHSPSLTPAERSALEQVPDDQLEANLTPYAGCCDNITDYAQVVIAMTFAIACTAGVQREEEELRHLSDQRIQRLGPVASARELLEIRREALGHEH